MKIITIGQFAGTPTLETMIPEYEPMWTLMIRSPFGKPREYILKPNKNTIGRNLDNDIVVSDISASRNHAKILFDQQEEVLTIYDLGSTNGTYVNREILSKPRKLNHNDVIRIGEHIINVTHQESMVPDDKGRSGTRLLTRDFLLESLDQHAVLMYEVARKLNTVLDLDTALREVSKMMRRSMGADKCAVILSEQFDQLKDLDFPATIGKTAIDQKAAVIFPDSGRKNGEIGGSAFLMRVKSALCIPVMTGDDVTGLIYMYKTDPNARPFDQRDLQLAVAISHQAALTIQRMHLLERVNEEQRIRHLLLRFVSPPEAEFLLEDYLKTGRLPELAERRVTVLFADIADSTIMAERLGAESFSKILSRYYHDLTDIIFEHDGILHKYLGDGVMAIFGMTEQKIKPEERAVRAGLRMLESVDAMNRDWVERIQIGVGVNTGTVVAGYMGTKYRVELTVLGNTVNVAFALQTNARPNRLLIGPATLAVVLGLFDTKRVGAIDVKGRLLDIQAHEVLKALKH